MRLLLDTNCYLWMSGSRRRLSPRAVEFVEAGDNELFVSAVTYWELAIKGGAERLGGFFNDLPTLVAQSKREFRLSELDITPAHAMQVINLPPLHNDPFDRMLVAQAFVEGLTLVSSDSQLRSLRRARSLVTQLTAARSSAWAPAA